LQVVMYARHTKMAAPVPGAAINIQSNANYQPINVNPTENG